MVQQITVNVAFQEPNSSLQQGTPEEMSSVLHFYVRPSGHEGAAFGHSRRKLQGKLPELQSVKTELCYNVNWTGWASYWLLEGGTPVLGAVSQGTHGLFPYS